MADTVMSEPEDAETPNLRKRALSPQQDDSDGKRQRVEYVSRSVEDINLDDSTSMAADSKNNTAQTAASENTGNTGSMIAGRKTVTAEEKQRSKRLFGGLNGLLARTKDPTARKRQAIEERRKEEMRQGDVLVIRGPPRDLEEREDMQMDVDEDNAKIKADNAYFRACFLATETQPTLYYRPWTLSTDEQAIVSKQIKYAKEIEKTQQWHSAYREQKGRRERGESVSSSEDSDTHQRYLRQFRDDLASEKPQIRAERMARHAKRFEDREEKLEIRRGLKRQQRKDKLANYKRYAQKEEDLYNGRSYDAEIAWEKRARTARLGQEDPKEHREKLKKAGIARAREARMGRDNARPSTTTRSRYVDSDAMPHGDGNRQKQTSSFSYDDEMPDVRVVHVESRQVVSYEDLKEPRASHDERRQDRTRSRSPRRGSS